MLAKAHRGYVDVRSINNFIAPLMPQHDNKDAKMAAMSRFPT